MSQYFKSFHKSDLFLLFLCSLLVNLTFFSFFDQSRIVESDTSFYLAIAKQLSKEFVYQDPSSPWPDQPSVGRSPLWPLIVSFFIRVFNEFDNNSLIRYTAMIFNISNTILIYFLVQCLALGRFTAVISGIVYSLHPTALYIAEQGLSEISFLTLALIGSIFAIRLGITSTLSMSTFGLSTLIRSNFILFGPLMIVFQFFNGSKTKIKALMLASICFAFFPSFWILRNYNATGEFPIFSSIRGETFYGAHNPLTFYSLDYFGYWVFPDEIPNEPKKSMITKELSEIQLDKYYNDRGKRYLAEHIRDFPRLIYGKLTRAYIPIPWIFDYGTIGVCMYRTLLYLLFFLGIKQFCSDNIVLRKNYLHLLGCMTICNLMTVIVFYGSIRFSFVIEPFLIPIAALTLHNLRDLFLGKGNNHVR